MAGGSMDVRVENQLVRFVCPTPLNHDQVVKEVGGQRNSGVVIKAMDRPRATLVIDEDADAAAPARRPGIVLLLVPFLLPQC